MKKTLILLTSSYPFGPGEPFIGNEIRYLQAAFDELVVVSNDLSSPQTYPVPDGAVVLRVPYDLSPWEKALAALSVFQSEPRSDLRDLPRYDRGITRRVVNTVLVSWRRAVQFSRVLKRLAHERPNSRVYVYSYWANDMAVAAALARKRGWVHAAISRAHRWDVYFEPGMNYLPFRRFLAENLDKYLFISEDGVQYFRNRVGDNFASLGCSRLGTERLGGGPLSARHPFLILSCSSLIPRKRVDLIVSALETLDGDATWVHIGEGPGRAAIESACARLPANIRVELMGQRSNVEVLQVLRTRKPSVFINLSDSEGVPVSIMEAMSAGVPVIATDVGGVREIVEDGENGRLLQPNVGAAEVCAALRSFSAMSDSEYGAYARRAWVTWNTKFDADKNYRAFLQEVLDES